MCAVTGRMLLRLDWFNIGLFLVLGGGVLSILSVSWRARNTDFATIEVLGPYAIGGGLSLLVILGGVMVLMGRHVSLGYPLIFVPSTLFPLWLFLFLAFPRPEDVVARILYEAIGSTGYLFYSLIGGIIILATHSREVTKP
jgi:hypothetical protein